jgi:hypothetical protein
MKKGILYLLAGLFLLFSIKSKSNLMLTLETGFAKHVGHLHLPKKSTIPNIEKSATAQETNIESLLQESSEENISNFADFHFIFYASIIGLAFIFSKLWENYHKIHFDNEIIYYLNKRFILLRSLRI